jgi:hypothetical protein
VLLDVGCRTPSVRRPEPVPLPPVRLSDPAIDLYQCKRVGTISLIANDHDHINIPVGASPHDLSTSSFTNLELNNNCDHLTLIVDCFTFFIVRY